MKLLVDECLSEELAKLAQRRGHAEASHIARIGKPGWKDWQLKSVILDGDWTFVTRKALIFVVRAIDRVPKDSTPMSRSTPAWYASTVRQGWILISNWEMFEEVLDELDQGGDLVNQVLEISIADQDEDFEVTRYRMPAA